MGPLIHGHSGTHPLLPGGGRLANTEGLGALHFGPNERGLPPFSPGPPTVMWPHPVGKDADK